MTIPHFPGSARLWLRSLTLASIAAIGLAADKSDINSLSPWRERIEGVAPAIASGGYGSHGSIVLGKTVPQRIPAGNVVLIKVADFQTIEFRPGVEVSGYLEAYDAEINTSTYSGPDRRDNRSAAERSRDSLARVKEAEAAENARRAALTEAQRVAEDDALRTRWGLPTSEQMRLAAEAKEVADIARKIAILNNALRVARLATVLGLSITALDLSYNYMAAQTLPDPNTVDLRLSDVFGYLGENGFSGADFGFGDKMGANDGLGSLGFGQGYGESGFGGIGVGSASAGDGGGGDGSGSGSGGSGGSAGGTSGRGGDSGGMGGHGAGL